MSFIGSLAAACVLLVAMTAMLFVTARSEARRAALYAFPQRRSLARSKMFSGKSALGRAFQRIWRNDVPEEHAHGRVDLHRVDVAALRDSPLVRPAPFTLLLKRLSDIALSLTLLLLSLPIWVAAAVAVKLDSAGPILYRQTRVGQNGQLFTVIKFRTMVSDAEAQGARWATVNDDRITRVGRFLRKTRIDEIPQAFTILKGDMSFIGPRPERPEFVPELSEAIPHYEERYRVKPGLTGWAQVNCDYASSIEETRTKLSYDLYYIAHFSLLLDLFILVKTVRVALRGEGSR